MSDPILSIIVTTYNAEQYIESTLQSVADQRVHRAAIEVLVIDGNSKDRTCELVRNFSVVTQLTSEPDGGIYDGMNKGARQARGKWLHFLNAGDTFADALALSAILEGLADADDHAWAVARAVNLGGGTGSKREIPSIPHTWFRHAIGLQPHCHQASFFQRATFLTAGGHSTDYGTAGDFDLILRFGALSTPYTVDRVCIEYLGGGVSEGRWRSSAHQQHRSRVSRLTLPPPLRLIDSAWAAALTTYLPMKVRAGKSRASLQQRWRRRG